MGIFDLLGAWVLCRFKHKVQYFDYCGPIWTMMILILFPGVGVDFLVNG